ncbi:MAG: hypothetical protein AAGC60_29890 [Acidobacteriota bacterium]
MRPLLFSIAYLGFSPRLASERSDSAEYRLEKICSLIESSALSIHDLSRLKASKVDEFYRLNMPFELGIDWGLRRFGSAQSRRKQFLILETNPHDFKIALSDLSGIDIKSHSDSPNELVRAVRDWFYETVGVKEAPSPSGLLGTFNDFSTALFEERIGRGLLEPAVVEDIERMSVTEYLDSVERWIESTS